jgi:peptide/nickel transport system substrate-binding protein
MVCKVKELKRLTEAVLLIAVSLMIISQFYVVQGQQIPREDTVFMIGVEWGTIRNMNPYSGNPTPLWGFAYLPLFTYSALKDVWIPTIAERYEFVDPRTIRIYIRAEATWSDGTPITAYDVEYTYYVTQQVGVGPGAGCGDYVEYMKAVGDKVVEARIKDPPRNYYSFLSCALNFWPLPKHVIQPIFEKGGKDAITKWDNVDPATQVVSGPYKIYYHSPSDRIILARFDNWWGSKIFGIPAPKYIAHLLYADNPAANAALEAGDADWAGTFIPEVWKLQAKGIYTWYKNAPYYVGSGVNFLYLNLKRPEYQNPAVRKAIAYALPYKDMLEKAYFGYSPQATAVAVNDLIPAYKKYLNSTLCTAYGLTPDCKFQTNIEKAKEILKEAGVDPSKIHIEIATPSGWTDWNMMSAMIAETLRQIGFDASAPTPDFSVWWDSLTKGTYYAVIGWDGGIGFDHPWGVYRNVMDPRLSFPTGNWEGYNNTEVIQYIDAIPQLMAKPEEQLKLISKLQEIFLRDLPAIPLFYGAHWYAYNTKYWVGWPNNDNPWWWPAAPWDTQSWPLPFGLAKSGQTPKVPEWIAKLEIPTSKIIRDLMQISMPTTTTPPATTAPPPTTAMTTTVTTTVVVPTTIVSTVVSTVSSVSTATMTATTTVTQRVTEWATTIAIAIALLIIGFAIGWITKRK